METVTVAVANVRGIEIDFNGRKVVVPPLSLGAVEALQERLAGYKGGLEDVSLVIDALHASLKRNYPAIAREEVAEMVDIGNMQEVMYAVMNVSRLIKKADTPGEAAGGPG